MSQPTVGKMKGRGKRLGRHILRSFGVHPRSSLSIANSSTTGAMISPASEAALSLSGNNSAPQFGKGEVGSLWVRALDSLSEKDKNTLGTNETGSNLDIEELIEAVREKREVCLENQWGFEFHGQSINLRYQADKIISWLAKFKEVGDIAIQQDPSHAALPWAGIRFLLQVGLPALHRIRC